MKLTPNEGNIDRVIRLSIGIVGLLVAVFLLSGVLQIVVIIASLAALITGLVGYCGLYTLPGINTCPRQK